MNVQAKPSSSSFDANAKNTVLLIGANSKEVEAKAEVEGTYRKNAALEKLTGTVQNERKRSLYTKVWRSFGSFFAAGSDFGSIPEEPPKFLSL